MHMSLTAAAIGTSAAMAFGPNPTPAKLNYDAWSRVLAKHVTPGAQMGM